MLYVVSISADPNTPKSSPVEKEVIIEEKYIQDVMIYFPPGHVCLTGLAIFYGSDQIFPHHEYEWVKGNDIAVKGILNWKCPEIPCRLKVKMYNDDVEYKHTAYVFINTSNISMEDVNNSIIELTKIMKAYVALLIGIEKVEEMTK